MPIPVSGDWKATVRMQVGRSVLGVPIHFPSDPAIPAPRVPAPAQFDRPFVLDKQLLQREQKKGVPSWLKTVAPLIVLMIGIGLVTILSFGLARIGRSGGRAEPTRQRPRWKPGTVPGAARPA